MALFVKYHAISCYITLKDHSISAISKIACYFFVVLVWSKQSYNKGVK
jgi:hypothetical protein